MVAFGLGAWLGWVLKSWLTNKHIKKLEETWAAQWQNREDELELTNAKLGALLNALQTSYNASQATIREASLAECQSNLGDLDARLAARTAELDRTKEALSREIQEWETKYYAAVQAQAAEIDRWQSRVRELESITVRAQEWEAKFLLVTSHKDAQINQLQQQLREHERLRIQTKHWMFSVLLQEREAAAAKLTSLHFRS
jgi:hypothetical protein